MSHPLFWQRPLVVAQPQPKLSEIFPPHILSNWLYLVILSTPSAHTIIADILFEQESAQMLVGAKATETKYCYQIRPPLFSLKTSVFLKSLSGKLLSHSFWPADLMLQKNSHTTIIKREPLQQIPYNSILGRLMFRLMCYTWLLETSYWTNDWHQQRGGPCKVNRTTKASTIIISIITWFSSKVLCF